MFFLPASHNFSGHSHFKMAFYFLSCFGNFLQQTFHNGISEIEFSEQNFQLEFPKRTHDVHFGTSFSKCM
ncbi:hypothetical protein VIGAN_01536400 [Vigna angularis var. angularis]|uniref:Uncharacterized protein n=1 Tax=Vigna angularis var. angularis TaxID=157739 RepID=A0A0S3R9Z9_PHAAN|nr:hypothetical protein VIGAN_01536400 [Vigna angularis var. angularis]